MHVMPLSCRNVHSVRGSCLLLVLAGWNGWQCRQCGAMHDAMVDRLYDVLCRCVILVPQRVYFIKAPASLYLNSLQCCLPHYLCDITWTMVTVPLDVAGCQTCFFC